MLLVKDQYKNALGVHIHFHRSESGRMLTSWRLLSARSDRLLTLSRASPTVTRRNITRIAGGCSQLRAGY